MGIHADDLMNQEIITTILIISFIFTIVKDETNFIISVIIGFPIITISWIVYAILKQYTKKNNFGEHINE